VHADTLSRAKHATWLSPLSAFTDVERSQLELLLRDTYDRFLERVAMGRKRDVAQIRDAAEGRVMGGARAKKLGLVDEVGGVGRALKLARERGNVARDAPVEAWPSTSDPVAALAGALTGARLNTPEWRLLEEMSRVAELSADATWVSHLAPGRPAAVLPAHLSVR